MNTPLSHTLMIPAILLISLAGCASSPPGEKPDQADLSSPELRKSAFSRYAMNDKITRASEALIQGDKLLQKGEKDEALYWYVKALDLEPANVKALNQIGALYRERGQYDLAYHAHELALKVAPANVEALEGCGLVKLGLRAYREAETCLKKALQKDPTRWRSHNALGLLADLQHRFEVAEDHYQKALKTAEKPDLVLNNLGYSRYLRGDWQGALQWYESALHHNPHFNTTWLNKGLIHARQGERDLALHAFGQVLNEAESYNNMGYLQWLEGHSDTAEYYLQQALTASPVYYGMARENLQLIHSNPVANHPGNHADFTQNR